MRAPVPDAASVPGACAPSREEPLVVVELLSDRACMSRFVDDMLEVGRLGYWLIGQMGD
jgi:hypothetical protein